MGIDYENVNKFEMSQYELFLPNFFSINKEEKDKKKLNQESREYSKMKNLGANSFTNLRISKSRKSTFDIEENESDKNELITKQDKIKNIFLSPLNGPFFSTEKELNLYKENEYYLVINEQEDIRRKYYSKLIYKNVWTPGMKSKTHNSLFIFDWDDTLFPTSFLINEGICDEDILSEELTKEFNILEEIIINILNYAIEKGDVYIITNSSISWFKYSSDKCYPNLGNILEKIKIISARDEYEKTYPGQNKFWKKKAFLSLKKEINPKLVTNIICFGDSIIELEAGKALACNLNEAFVKRIKFKENPEIEDLIKQLNLIKEKIGFIYSKAKNLFITIEQKF